MNSVIGIELNGNSLVSTAKLVTALNNIVERTGCGNRDSGKTTEITVAQRLLQK